MVWSCLLPPVPAAAATIMPEAALSLLLFVAWLGIGTFVRRLLLTVGRAKDVEEGK